MAKRKLRDILIQIKKIPELKKQGPHLPWKVEVLCIGEGAMRHINSIHRRKKMVTDVLSFPAAQFFFENGYLGDLVLCVPVLKRQAKFFKHTPQRELKILLVHGVLHLLGFDHEKNKKAAAIMARWESRLLGDTGLIERRV